MYLRIIKFFLYVKCCLWIHNLLRFKLADHFCMLSLCKCWNKRDMTYTRLTFVVAHTYRFCRTLNARHLYKCVSLYVAVSALTYAQIEAAIVYRNNYRYTQAAFARGVAHAVTPDAAGAHAIIISISPNTHRSCQSPRSPSSHSPPQHGKMSITLLCVCVCAVCNAEATHTQCYCSCARARTDRVLCVCLWVFVSDRTSRRAWSSRSPII